MLLILLDWSMIVKSDNFIVNLTVSGRLHLQQRVVTDLHQVSAIPL